MPTGTVRERLFRYSLVQRLCRHPLVLERPTTSPHREVPHSPQLEFVRYWREVSKYSKVLRSELERPLSVISIGGGSEMAPAQVSKFPKDTEFTIFDLERVEDGHRSLQGDICDAGLSVDETFDIVFSHNAFEHFKQPWIAAANCMKFSSPGSLQMHVAPFSWRYHDVPGDYFRYTHEGLAALFSGHELDCETLAAAYDASNRRGKLQHQHGARASDIPPRDDLGGFLENWKTIYIARVCEPSHPNSG